MNRFRTSIALATYQGARHLRQQLESYAVQTRLPNELIVSDDGSTDGTQTMVEEFSRNAPFPVKLVTNFGERRIQFNFENAVRYCAGEVILFSDHDDVWLPQHIEKLTGALEANEQILAVSSNSQIVDQDLNLLGYTLAESERCSRRLCAEVTRLPTNQLELILRWRILAGHGMAFRRSIIPLILPFSQNSLHDFWVYFLAASIGRVTYIDEPLTLYRTHGGQRMGGKRMPLRTIAANMSQQTGDDSHIWRALLERLKQFPDRSLDHDYSVRLLEAKLQFVQSRTRNRRRALPTRFMSTSLELLKGRYHRLGRGFITFARDLYGTRG